MQDTIGNLEGEVWKDIPGYEGAYMASNMGRIKSLDRYIIYGNGIKCFRGGRILKGCLDAYGYKYSQFYGKNLKHHRCIALAFIKNVDNKPQVNHIDGNGLNNTISNLEWVTNLENQRHSWNMLGRRSSQLGKIGFQSSTGKPVMQIDKNGNTIKIWGSANDAEKNTGICNQNISKVCFGKRKTAGGFKWKFRDAEGMTRIGQSDEYVLGDDGIYIPYSE